MYHCLSSPFFTLGLPVARQTPPSNQSLEIPPYNSNSWHLVFSISVIAFAPPAGGWCHDGGPADVIATVHSQDAFSTFTPHLTQLKDKGTRVKETWGTISTAIDAQMTMEEMAKLEERGGDDWTEEKKAEYDSNSHVAVLKELIYWTMDKFVETEIARIKTIVGGKGQVIGAVSGGVESTVAAKLMQQAIGEPVCVVSIVLVQTRRGFALR
jgi:hypothetical protein